MLFFFYQVGCIISSDAWSMTFSARNRSVEWLFSPFFCSNEIGSVIMHSLIARKCNNCIRIQYKYPTEYFLLIWQCYSFARLPYRIIKNNYLYMIYHRYRCSQTKSILWLRFHLETWTKCARKEISSQPANQSTSKIRCISIFETKNDYSNLFCGYWLARKFATRQSGS